MLKTRGRICILGDFNSRIGEIESVVNSNERGEESDIIFKRESQDKKINSQGRSLVSFMNDLDFIILNGIHKKALFSSVQTRDAR